MGSVDSGVAFFSDVPNKNVLGIFLERHSANDRFAQETKRIRLETCLAVIRSIFNDPVDWDNVCRFNVKYIGNHFVQKLSSSKLDEDDLDQIFVCCMRLLLEFEFWDDGDKLEVDLKRIADHVISEVDSYGDKIKSQLKFAVNVMPARIIKEMINDPKVEIYKEFIREKRAAEEFRDSWQSSINETLRVCSGLTEELGKHKTAFNFVGLYSGFSSLFDSKVKEAKRLWIWICSIGAAVLAPIALELGYLSYKIYKGEVFDINHFMMFVPIASIVFILIYYLRVFLKDHSSVKAQIVQIQLRMTLCQFIQDYAKYASEIKRNDGVALDKFESVIFSGIAGDFDKVPSTFDGLEQLAKLVKAVKGNE